MIKPITYLLLGLSLSFIVSCSSNTESIRSNDIYTKIPEGKMVKFCRNKIMKEFGYSRNSIFLNPVEYKKGAKLVYGKYQVDNKNMDEFVCIFNSNDTYAGIKMRYSHIKNELCYPKIIRY